MPAARTKKRRWLRTTLIVLGVLTGLIIGASVLDVDFSYEKDETAADEFETSKIEKGDIESRLTETGTTYLENTVDIMSKVSGTVTLMTVEMGDSVQKGQLVAVVAPDNTELLRLYGRRAQVANSYVQMVQAKDDLSHSEKLFNAVQGTSRDNVLRKRRGLSTAKTNFQLSLLELHILEKDMEIRGGMANRVMSIVNKGDEAEVLQAMDESLEVLAGDSTGFIKLADVRVLSPTSGIVISRGVDVGEMILSGTSSLSRGTVLLRTGDLGSMFISCRISEVDAGKVTVGQQAKIMFEAFPEDTHISQIIWISPIGSVPQGSSIVSFKIKIKLDATPEYAKPGMSCDIDIITAQKKQVLMALLESVATDDEEKYVFVKKGDDFEKRIITTGIADDKHCEVLSGLEEGEQIVTDIDEYEEVQEEKRLEADGEKNDKADKSSRRRGHRRIR